MRVRLHSCICVRLYAKWAAMMQQPCKSHLGVTKPGAKTPFPSLSVCLILTQRQLERDKHERDPSLPGVNDPGVSVKMNTQSLSLILTCPPTHFLGSRPFSLRFVFPLTMKWSRSVSLFRRATHRRRGGCSRLSIRV